jgi:hypothetical protein
VVGGESERRFRKAAGKRREVEGSGCIRGGLRGVGAACLHLRASVGALIDDDFDIRRLEYVRMRSWTEDARRARGLIVLAIAPLDIRIGTHAAHVERAPLGPSKRASRRQQRRQPCVGDLGTSTRRLAADRTPASAATKHARTRAWARACVHVARGEEGEW